MVPTANLPVKLVVEGEATLLAAGNANPELNGSFTDKDFKLFRGKGLVIIRSSGKAGDIRILLKAEGVKEAEINLLVVP